MEDANEDTILLEDPDGRRARRKVRPSVIAQEPMEPLSSDHGSVLKIRDGWGGVLGATS